MVYGRQGGGWLLPTIRRKMQPRNLVGASVACSMMGDMMSDLGCWFGRGI